MRGPRVTSPHASLAHTTEGGLAVAFNMAMLAGPMMSARLSPETAAKCAMVVNVAVIVSRTALKAMLVQYPPGPPAPLVQADFGAVPRDGIRR